VDAKKGCICAVINNLRNNTGKRQKQTGLSSFGTQPGYQFMNKDRKTFFKSTKFDENPLLRC